MVAVNLSDYISQIHLPEFELVYSLVLQVRDFFFGDPSSAAGLHKAYVNYTDQVVPDMIGKLAFDPSRGHFEIGGIERRGVTQAASPNLRRRLAEAMLRLLVRLPLHASAQLAMSFKEQLATSIASTVARQGSLSTAYETFTSPARAGPESEAPQRQRRITFTRAFVTTSRKP